MNLEQRQYQGFSQKMVMSQKMLASINLLGMSNERFQEEIARKLKTNPYLKELGRKISSNTGGAAGAEASDKHQQMMEGLADTSHETLQAKLKQQARENIDDDATLEAAKMIISNLDKNGFNAIPLRDLFEEARKEEWLPNRAIKNAIEKVQRFDPIGCACNSWRHSLLVQAKINSSSEKTGELLDVYKEVYELTEKIIKDYPDVLPKAENTTKFIQALKRKGLEITEDQAKNLIDFFKGLTLYPGRLNSSEDINKVLVQPLAEIQKVGNRFVAVPLNNGFKSLEIFDDDADLDKKLTKEEKKQKQAFLNEARDLIEAVKARTDTINRVLQAILDVQQGFFAGRICRDSGETKYPGYLKPLIQQDVAEKLDIEISTVSRSTKGKYILCAWMPPGEGIIEIKSLFSPKLKNSVFSQDFVMRQVEEIIKSSEGKLSDAKISKILSKQGIEVKTRTVNKYRHKLDIKSSYNR